MLLRVLLLVGISCFLIFQSVLCSPSFKQFTAHNHSTVRNVTAVQHLNITSYVGRWYQMYTSLIPDQTFESKGFCTVDYVLIIPISPLAESFRVINSENVGSPNGTVTQTKGTIISIIPKEKEGNFILQYDQLKYPVPYWVISLGLIEPNRTEYPWAVVSNPSQTVLFILARNISEFEAKYERIVLADVASLGFTEAYNKPIKTYQSEQECRYPEPPPSPLNYSSSNSSSATRSAPHNISLTKADIDTKHTVHNQDKYKRDHKKHRYGALFTTPASTRSKSHSSSDDDNRAPSAADRAVNNKVKSNDVNMSHKYQLKRSNSDDRRNTLSHHVSRLFDAISTSVFGRQLLAEKDQGDGNEMLANSYSYGSDDYNNDDTGEMRSESEHPDHSERSTDQSLPILQLQTVLSVSHADTTTVRTSANKARRAQESNDIDMPTSQPTSQPSTQPSTQPTTQPTGLVLTDGEDDIYYTETAQDDTQDDTPTDDFADDTDDTADDNITSNNMDDIYYAEINGSDDLVLGNLDPSASPTVEPEIFDDDDDDKTDDTDIPDLDDDNDKEDQPTSQPTLQPSAQPSSVPTDISVNNDQDLYYTDDDAESNGVGGDDVSGDDVSGVGDDDMYYQYTNSNNWDDSLPSSTPTTAPTTTANINNEDDQYYTEEVDPTSNNLPPAPPLDLNDDIYYISRRALANEQQDQEQQEEYEQTAKTAVTGEDEEEGSEFESSAGLAFELDRAEYDVDTVEITEEPEDTTRDYFDNGNDNDNDDDDRLFGAGVRDREWALFDERTRRNNRDNGHQHTAARHQSRASPSTVIVVPPNSVLPSAHQTHPGSEIPVPLSNDQRSVPTAYFTDSARTATFMKNRK